KTGTTSVGRRSGAASAAVAARRPAIVSANRESNRVERMRASRGNEVPRAYASAARPGGEGCGRGEARARRGSGVPGLDLLGGFAALLLEEGLSMAPHSSASTPLVISTRWLSRGS